jgi:hypothetical protein
VRKGQCVAWGDVAVDATTRACRLRKEMESWSVAATA